MGIQKSFHRYIASLLAVIFPALAVMEIAQADMESPLAPIRWASYLVLGIWALYLAQNEELKSLSEVSKFQRFAKSQLKSRPRMFTVKP